MKPNTDISTYTMEKGKIILRGILSLPCMFLQNEPQGGFHFLHVAYLSRNHDLVQILQF